MRRVLAWWRLPVSLYELISICIGDRLQSDTYVEGGRRTVAGHQEDNMTCSSQRESIHEHVNSGGRSNTIQPGQDQSVYKKQLVTTQQWEDEVRERGASGVEKWFK